VPSALITGVTGQDGSYLAELLLAKGYDVHGVVRPGDGVPARPWSAAPRLRFLEGDLLDQTALDDAVAAASPDEVYHLAADSVVQSSWDQPVRSSDVTALGAARVLEAVRRHAPAARFFNASSSEIFGAARESPQRETTPVAPRTPYGVAKAFGHFLTRSYREGLGLFAVSGVLYNHESPRRGPGFVTRKVTRAVAAISRGSQRELRLGDLDARRDWGFAGDYVDAMWRMLQADAPDDFVVGTGETHTVRELCELAFDAVGLDYRDHVVSDPAFRRPAESALMVADASRARERLGWTPTVTFEQLVRRMVDADLRELDEARGRGSTA
jgi:GDPmannose 4,6-dehydratase